MPTLVLFAAGLALALWCLADLLPRADSEVQTLPKSAWVVVLVLMPLVGGLAYLLAGRPTSARGVPSAGGRLSRRPAPGPPAARGPEDDPEFSAQLRRRVAEQRRRAQQQRSEEQPEG